MPSWQLSTICRNFFWPKKIKRTSLNPSNHCSITHIIFHIHYHHFEPLRIEKQIASIWTRHTLLLKLMRQFKEEVVSAWRCLWSHNNRICCSAVFCASRAVLNVLIHSLNTALEVDMRERVSEYMSFDKTAGVGICFLSPFMFDDYTQSSRTPFHIELKTVDYSL